MKGRNNLRRDNELYRPCRACGHVRFTFPRALPWADLFQPFGLRSRPWYLMRGGPFSARARSEMSGGKREPPIGYAWSPRSARGVGPERSHECWAGVGDRGNGSPKWGLSQ